MSSVSSRKAGLKIPSSTNAEISQGPKEPPTNIIHTTSLSLTTMPISEFAHTRPSQLVRRTGAEYQSVSMQRRPLFEHTLGALRANTGLPTAPPSGTSQGPISVKPLTTPMNVVNA